MDIGGKFNSSFLSFQVDLNYAFVNNPRFAASVDPTFSVSFAAGDFGPIDDAQGTFGAVGLPLLADVVRTDSVTLTLALKPSWVFGDDIEPDNALGIETGFLLGASVGVRIQLSEGFALLPEFSFAKPMESDIDDHYLYTATLGFVF